MGRIAAFVALRACVVSAQSAPAVPAETRAAFLKLVDRPRVDPAPAVRSMAAPASGLMQEHFSLTVDAGQRVIGILVKPENAQGRLPVVIQLHGTGGRREQLLPRLKMLAERGFVAIAIDARYHGEREAERAVQGFRWALDHGAWDSRAWTFRDALEAAASESKTQVNAAMVNAVGDDRKS